MKSPNANARPFRGDEYSVDREEILGFHARFLLDLPLDTTLTLDLPGFDQQVILTTRVLERPRLPSEQIGFDKEEMRALIFASESERARLHDLRQWCWMKRENPDFELSLEIALSGANPATGRLWNVGQIMEWLEVDLVSVTVCHTADKEDGSVAEAA